jgi:uncharacterized membrane protein YkvA (DUF1232 family)
MSAPASNRGAQHAPHDLRPDFIPALGYGEDVLLLPGLTAAIARLGGMCRHLEFFVKRVDRRRTDQGRGKSN